MADWVPQEAEVEEQPAEKDYSEQVADVASKHSHRKELTRFLSDNDIEHASTHVSQILTGSGVKDFNHRLAKLEQALRERTSMMKEKRSKKMEKLLKATTKSVRGETADQSEDSKSKSTFDPAKALAAAAFVEVSELKTNWSEVQVFRTQFDAIRFIIECQPFDYRPAGAQYDDFPRFQSSRDALAYVMQLQPSPEEFVSQEAIFQRRLRVRKAAPGETKEEVAAKLAIKKHRSLTGRGKQATGKSLGVQSTGTEPKRWLVEAAGSLFEVPTSLRPLKEVSQRFYIAVPIDLEKKVLSEGFRVSRRLSIPCSGTPQQALAAFLRNEQREKKEKESQARQKKEDEGLGEGFAESAAVVARGRRTVEALDQGTKGTVLAVTITPEMKIDVVAHRDGGFQIKCQSLPGSCFQRAKRTDKEG
mmetsp:Transcript_52190/g.93613  ORF Transcript_52190/g.93613 Transcript_52190/m.93613 type:complete len:418 (-) Transcript_52190:91-1344(-)|eukprot:CAMPEP_0197628634 /NCGR_PEP_ID=MMETSP1338-20131121/6855_1 /TAXON_ID=43686 ORGANISM="Pelagodinium beii, Strain RCC1491" /NCGR_SAMPLE_ID=MMETSP1338 /ASSEMBLY_ACC=CAM_ASM_000754 /LENGTH=417 /DNA_ID=CAMNT_0043199621 /DNA_START=73 /DNA_END=1326 /DNA_ORIENTATION=+